ncbi:MAG: acyltransferase [Clostridia bacterium]|nr:acyltransferase [Clostridia bacterium]
MIDKKERNHSLDIYKGICILLIVLTHSKWTDSERLKLLFPFWVDIAVPIFMIISGYLYSLSFQKHEIDTIGKAYRLKTVLNKVIRYTLPFLVIFIIEKIIIVLNNGNIGGPVSLLYNFLQGANGPGGYYYPILLQFVFVFPIIYFIIKKYDFKGLILCAALNFLFEILKNAYMVKEVSYRLIVLRYVFVIAFGCYLAVGKKHIKRLEYSACFLAGVTYIIVFKYLGKTPIFTQFWTETSFWACMYILPIAAFLMSKNISFKPLEIIGKASYNIFLVQMVYYWCCSEMIYDRFSFVNKYLILLFNIIVCTVIGIVFYYAETPVTKYVIKKTNGIIDKIKK